MASNFSGLAAEQKSKDMSLDFNKIANRLTLGAAEGPAAAHLYQQAPKPTFSLNPGDISGDAHQSQVSFISAIQREKDASFAIMNQTNLSLLHNS